LKAVRILQQAQVVVYDHLVSEEVMQFLPEQAERIFAGKRRNEHSMRQEGINQLLVDLARAGKRVVRLKGGDPFIFGRGGEEMQALAAAGVPFKVVPGITAASAASCYAGIPLTHRDFAQSVVLVTGHLKDGTADLDWPHLVKPHQTVVIYMGLNGAASICHQLIAHGAPPDRAIAVVQTASLPTQQVLLSTLADLPNALALAPMQSPSLLIVGDVAALHTHLAWFQAA
jgi:uroporphyrin-III C-methyltransferase/precorrin-2 dehydrogenase/sirohydrochlorin ferrochelatase